MGHFAKVVNGEVVTVIKADQDVIDSYNEPGVWIQTSYNTHKGVHTNGGTPLRKNFASAGFTYDSERDAFIPPKPYTTWILNEDTCVWDAPKPYPADGKPYIWDDSAVDWVERPY
jgi:hypothetical protein